jgi:hypothetical protein
MAANLADDKGDLGLHLGLDESTHGNGVAIQIFHVVEQHSEVGLIHSQLLLHCFAGESNLEANDSAGWIFQASLCIELSHLVGSVEPGNAKGFGYPGNRAAGAASLVWPGQQREGLLMGQSYGGAVIG